MRMSRWTGVWVAGLVGAAVAACGSDSGSSGGADAAGDSSGEDGGAPDGDGGEGGDAADSGGGDSDAGGDTGGDGANPDTGGDGGGEDTADTGETDAGGEDGGGEDGGGEDTGGEGGGSVVLNEVVYSTIDGSPDFAELLNTSDAAVDLSGWVFRDDKDDHAFVFPDDTVLSPGAFLVLWGEGGSGLTFAFGLGGTDAARLFDASGVLMDDVSWEGDPAPPGRAYGRYPDGTGPWDTLESATPGEPNAQPYQVTANWPPLLVNEVVASATGDGPDWVELFNPTNEAVSLDGWLATDKPSTPPAEWLTLGALTVPANGYLVLYGPNAPEGSDFDFGLGAGDDFLLAAPDFTTIDHAEWEPGWAPTGFSYGRNPDDEGDFATLDTPTPHAANEAPTKAGDAPQPNSLTIAEFMASTVAVADADGEWIEIVNAFDSSLDIDGWIIADGGGSWHRIDKGGAWVLPPGGRAVLGRNGNSATNGGYTADYVYGADISLSNTSDSIVVLAWGKEVDRIDYDELEWPLGPGASVQLDPAATKPIPNDFPSNWCLSTTAYGAGDLGTPGSPNLDCP